MTEWPDGSPVSHFTVEPMPPSTNNLYGNHPGGRHKTPAYKRWAEAAGWHIVQQKPPSVLGHHLAVLIAGPLRVDVDNIKALLDLLSMPVAGKSGVRLGIIEDDRFIDDLRIVRAPQGAPLAVSIWSLENEGFVGGKAG